MTDVTFPQGICPQHGPLLSVNGEVKCIKCEAIETNKGRVSVVNTTPDPKGALSIDGKIVKGIKVGTDTVLTKTDVKAVQIPYTLESGLKEILSILSYIPMPKSMKQYKLLMAVKQKIEAALLEG